MKTPLLIAIIAVSALGQEIKLPIIPDALLVERLNVVVVNLATQLRLTQLAGALDRAKLDIVISESKLKQDVEASRKDYERVIAKINDTVCKPAGTVIEEKDGTISCAKQASDPK